MIFIPYTFVDCKTPNLLRHLNERNVGIFLSSTMKQTHRFVNLIASLFPHCTSIIRKKQCLITSANGPKKSLSFSVSAPHTCWEEGRFWQCPFKLSLIPAYNSSPGFQCHIVMLKCKTLHLLRHLAGKASMSTAVPSCHHTYGFSVFSSAIWQLDLNSLLIE